MGQNNSNTRTYLRNDSRLTKRPFLRRCSGCYLGDFPSSPPQVHPWLTRTTLPPTHFRLLPKHPLLATSPISSILNQPSRVSSTQVSRWRISYELRSLARPLKSPPGTRGIRHFDLRRKAEQGTGILTSNPLEWEHSVSFGTTNHPYSHTWQGTY